MDFPRHRHPYLAAVDRKFHLDVLDRVVIQPEVITELNDMYVPNCAPAPLTTMVLRLLAVREPLC